MLAVTATTSQKIVDTYAALEAEHLEIRRQLASLELRKQELLKTIQAHREKKQIQQVLQSILNIRE
ncbi:MAG TPA: hypothetical protein VJB37_02795 [Patescibacteria group bacterium]|nr:hypothetical protein [Patescibacteria group bacterium]